MLAVARERLRLHILPPQQRCDEMRKVIMKDPNKKQSPASIIGGFCF